MPHSTSTIQIHRDIEGPAHGLKPFVMILLGLAVLCFLAAFYQKRAIGEKQTFRFDPAATAESQTFTVTDPHTIYTVSVYQSTAGLATNRDWSDVSIRIEGRKGDKVLAFGSDFWKASGYDDGPWSENKNRYEMNTVFPVAGTYTLHVEHNSNPPNYHRPIGVELQRQRGSTIPLMVLGVIALLGGIVLGLYDNRQAVGEALQNVEFD